MLFLFGRYSQPVKVVLGVAAIVVGIVIHQAFWAAAGGVLLVWGAAALLNAARKPGAGRGKAQ
jgi:hypothetical protein